MIYNFSVCLCSLVRVFDKKEACEIFGVSLETADKILATFVESHQMYLQSCAYIFQNNPYQRSESHRGSQYILETADHRTGKTEWKRARRNASNCPTSQPVRYTISSHFGCSSFGPLTEPLIYHKTTIAETILPSPQNRGPTEPAITINDRQNK